MYSFLMGAMAPLLAAFDGADVILNGGAAVADTVSNAWDSIWNDVLRGGVYRALCNAAIFIALICLMMFIVQFARKWLESGSGGDWIVAELFLPLLVIVLLTNQGALLAQVSTALRGMINEVNQQVLTTTAASTRFDATLSGLADHQALKSQLQRLRSNCNGIVDNAELRACLENANASAQMIIADYNRKNGGTFSRWGQDLRDYAQQAFSDPLTAISTVAVAAANPVGTAANVGLDATVSLGNLALTGIVETVLLACMFGFQHILEASMLLTALIAPIPVAASLLPFGAKPIYAWATGFLSLGVIKLSFNITVGVVGTVIAQAGPTSTGPLVLAVVLGILSPFLAMGIGTGGGVAIFQGIVSGVGAVTNYAARKF